MCFIYINVNSKVWLLFRKFTTRTYPPTNFFVCHPIPLRFSGVWELSKNCCLATFWSRMNISSLGTSAKQNRILVIFHDFGEIPRFCMILHGFRRISPNHFFFSSNKTKMLFSSKTFFCIFFRDVLKTKIVSRKKLTFQIPKTPENCITFYEVPILVFNSSKKSSHSSLSTISFIVSLMNTVVIT